MCILHFLEKCSASFDTFSGLEILRSKARVTTTALKNSSWSSQCLFIRGTSEEEEDEEQEQKTRSSRERKEGERVETRRDAEIHRAHARPVRVFSSSAALSMPVMQPQPPVAFPQMQSSTKSRVECATVRALLAVASPARLLRYTVRAGIIDNCTTAAPR